MHLTFRADADTTEWLNEKDATLSVEVARALGRPQPRVLEIGVWKGAWTVTMAGNLPDSVQVGIDPYPRGAVSEAARSRAIAQIERHGLRDRIQLVASWEELAHLADRPQWFDVVHIDGKHTQEAVEVDLTETDRVLADDGVVIVDDYRNVSFPGVAFAMYRFLEQADYRIFLVTENKAFITRAASAAHWHQTMRNRLAGQSTIAWLDTGGAAAASYGVTAVPDVLGSPILLCTPPLRTATPVPLPAKQRAARVLREWLPPVAFRALLRGWGYLRGRGPHG